LELAELPGTIRRSEEEPVVETEGEDVQEPDRSHAAELPPDAPPQARRGLAHLDDAH
jgi:hypothetical protein